MEYWGFFYHFFGPHFIHKIHLKRHRIACFFLIQNISLSSFWHTRYNDQTGTGRGAVWLARCVRDAEVMGSNPIAPTTSLRQNFPLFPLFEANFIRHNTTTSDNPVIFVDTQVNSIKSLICRKKVLSMSCGQKGGVS